MPTAATTPVTSTQASDPFPNLAPEIQKYVTHKKQGQVGYDIEQALQPYVDQLTNLGPEYAAEMKYLEPYLAPNQSLATEQAVAKSFSPDVATQTPNALNTALTGAEETTQAATEAEQPALEKAFADAGAGAKEYAKTVPSTSILDAILQAGRNEILYGSVPNLTNIDTTNWEPSLKAVYSYLTQSAGVTPGGLPTPSNAITTLPATTPAVSSSTGGGGNTS